jgi:hypothetical protein
VGEAPVRWNAEQGLLKESGQNVGVLCVRLRLGVLEKGQRYARE